ncbi:hypothetical protein [Hydrotalea sp.]|uniref:hypothetical protein n=1 Tax=Hydrotalea sp. TaxID=2881279 RepID=UPI003D0A9CCE
MATMHNNFMFTGSIGNVTAYRIQGSDKIYLRTKGGANKQKIKNHPNFAFTRALNREFAERVWAAKQLLQAIIPLKQVVNYNLMAAFNRLCYTIQTSDTMHPIGERSILFSNCKHYLPGFQFNNRYVFDQVMQGPLSFQIDRDSLMAKVHVSDLLPKIHLTLPWMYSYYRFTLVLAIIQDCCIPSTQNYSNQNAVSVQINSIHTHWNAVKAPLEENLWQLQLRRASVLQPNETMILSIGIEAGDPITNELIMPVKHIGAGKILGVA